MSRFYLTYNNVVLPVKTECKDPLVGDLLIGYFSDLPIHSLTRFTVHCVVDGVISNALSTALLLSDIHNGIKVDDPLLILDIASGNCK
jgi:flavoprotein